MGNCRFIPNQMEARNKEGSNNQRASQTGFKSIIFDDEYFQFKSDSSTNKQNFQFTEKIFTRMKFLFRYDGIIEEEGWAVEGGLKMEKNCII